MSPRSAFRLLYFMSAAFLALALFLVAVERVNADNSCRCVLGGYYETHADYVDPADCPVHGPTTF